MKIIKEIIKIFKDFTNESLHDEEMMKVMKELKDFANEDYSDICLTSLKGVETFNFYRSDINHHHLTSLKGAENLYISKCDNIF